MFIKEAVKQIEVSDIRRIAEKMNGTEDEINLTIGEPDLEVPQVIKEAVAYHALNTKIKYSPVGGLPELRKKIAEFYNKKFGGNYNGDNVIVTVGSTEGLSSTLETILTTGDEVLIPTPSYVGYEPLIKIYGATPIFMDLRENNFNLTREILEKYITDKTKLIILTYPNNPSGTIMPETEMRKIVDLLKEKEIYLVSDEIYASVAFGEYTSFAKFSKELYEQLIIVSGFSKSHGMTGYRIGYTITSEKTQAHVKKVSQYNIASPSTLSQYAAITALDNCYDTSEFSKVYERRVKYMISELEKIGFKVLEPKGAFYIFASYEGIEKIKNMKSYDFVMDLLEKTKLGIVPGSTFKVEGYVRISIIFDEPVLKEAINRIKNYIDNL